MRVNQITEVAYEKKNPLIEGPILKCLLAFAVPIILTNLVQQLYSMADLIVIGQFVGNVGTVGVNNGSEFSDVISPMPWAFATAGQILIAQLVGKGDYEKVKKTIGTLISSMLTLSFVLVLISLTFCTQILVLINCPAEAFAEAKAYMQIVAVGLPAVFGYNAVVGVLTGVGESKKPLLFVCIAATVNVVLDLAMVIICKMGVVGTALATSFSQYASFIAAYCYLWKNREQFGFELKISYFRIDISVLKGILKLGVPLMAKGMLVRVAMLWITATANSFGMIVSATSSIGNKLLKFLEVFVLGTDQAGAAMIGQNLGARKIDRAGRVTLCTFLFGMSCTVVIISLCIFAPHHIFGLFTQDAQVLEMGITYLHIMVLYYIVSAINGSFQTMITGSGYASMGLVLGILDGVICKVGLSWVFINVFQLGYAGLFWGIACSRVLPAIISVGYFVSGKWKTRKLLV